MRKPGGYAIWTDPDLPAIERDTITCKHCNSVVFVKPGVSAAEMGGYCSLCAAPICKDCVGKSCEPFEKKIEKAERQEYQKRQLSKMLGG